MAASNATAYPVNAQTYRLYFVIRSSSTQNPITGGLTALTATISKDGGAFGATANAPVEIGSSGCGYLDLSATEMTCSAAVVQISASNANAVTVALTILPLSLAEFSGRYDAQSVLRFEQMVHDIHSFLWNQIIDTGAQQQVYDANGTLKASATITEGDTSASRGKIA